MDGKKLSAAVRRAHQKIVEAEAIMPTTAQTLLLAQALREVLAGLESEPTADRWHVIDALGNVLAEVVSVEEAESRARWLIAHDSRYAGNLPLWVENSATDKSFCVWPERNKSAKFTAAQIEQIGAWLWHMAEDRDFNRGRRSVVSFLSAESGTVFDAVRQGWRDAAEKHIKQEEY